MEGRQAAPGTIAPSSSLRYSARGHVTLLDPESAYGYKGTYLGKKKVLTVGAAYQFEPEVTYVDTDTRARQGGLQGLDGGRLLRVPARRRRRHRLGRLREGRPRRRLHGAPTPTPAPTGLFGAKNGWYAKGGFLLPGAPLQFFGRYEKWRFACLNNVFDQIVDWYGFGANYYVWGQNLKLTAEWSKTDFDQEGTFTSLQSTRTTKDFSQFVAQIQFIF